MQPMGGRVRLELEDALVVVGRVGEGVRLVEVMRHRRQGRHVFRIDLEQEIGNLRSLGRPFLAAMGAQLLGEDGSDLAAQQLQLVVILADLGQQREVKRRFARLATTQGKLARAADAQDQAVDIIDVGRSQASLIEGHQARIFQFCLSGGTGKALGGSLIGGVDVQQARPQFKCAFRGAGPLGGGRQTLGRRGMAGIDLEDLFPSGCEAGGILLEIGLLGLVHHGVAQGDDTLAQDWIGGSDRVAKAKHAAIAVLVTRPFELGSGLDEIVADTRGDIVEALDSAGVGMANGDQDLGGVFDLLAAQELLGCHECGRGMRFGCGDGRLRDLVELASVDGGPQAHLQRIGVTGRNRQQFVCFGDYRIPVRSLPGIAHGFEMAAQFRRRRRYAPLRLGPACRAGNDAMAEGGFREGVVRNVHLLSHSSYLPGQAIGDHHM